MTQTRATKERCGTIDLNDQGEKRKKRKKKAIDATLKLGTARFITDCTLYTQPVTSLDTSSHLMVCLLSFMTVNIVDSLEGIQIKNERICNYVENKHVLYFQFFKTAALHPKSINILGCIHLVSSVCIYRVESSENIEKKNTMSEKVCPTLLTGSVYLHHAHKII